MNSNWSYSPETPNLGQIRRFLEPCDLEIWRMTFKNNRAPLLNIINLYASFHCHMWIQTGVRVRKRLSWVLTSVTLTFYLWPWPFALTSLLTMVITPENFMMIRWWEHGEKGVTDGQTDGRTENTICRAAWSQLKMSIAIYQWMAIPVFSCDQAALWMVFSVCLSVCVSFCPSHLFDYDTIIVSSWNFQELSPW